MSSSRNFCFTLNNYTDLEVENVKKAKCRFIQFGKEIGEEGTPHLQGFICFESAKTFSAVKKTLQTLRVHLEVARGNVDQNLAYTGKDVDIYKRGDPPMSQKEKGLKGEAYWHDIKVKLDEGRDDELPNSFLIHHYKCYEHFKNKRLRAVKLEDVTDKHEWFHGKTRTGKSKRAREIAGKDVYLKDTTKWWDGYNGQEYVLIENMDPSQSHQLRYIKIWTDRYPFPAEMKGKGQVMIRPKKIIVTSNFKIEDIWPDPKKYELIKEHFTETEFKSF